MRWWVLSGVGLLILGTTLANWINNPPEAASGLARFGVNVEGELTTVLAIFFGEVVFLVGVLRPWSYSRNWRRCVVGALGLVPFALFYLLATQHSGPVSSSLALGNHVVILLLVSIAAMDYRAGRATA